MEYQYRDETLLHSIGFNLQRLESILNNGLLSYNKAVEKGLNIAKNYNNPLVNNDYISALKVGFINLDVQNTIYSLYISKGISFIMEGVPYASNQDELFIHRFDEVLIKDEVSPDKFVGLAIPEEYQDMPLTDLTIIPLNITNYPNIVAIIDNYLVFLKKYGLKDIEVVKSDIKDYLKEIVLINQALSKNPSVEDKEELLMDYKDVLEDLNYYLGSLTSICFTKTLGYTPNLKEAVLHISQNKYNIYDIPYGNKPKR